MSVKPGMPKVTRAARMAVEQLEQRVLLAVTPRIPAWFEEGPGLVTGPNTGAIIPATATVGANPSVGAVHAVATLPNSADVIFIGAVNGGIWRTLNGTAASPAWEALGQKLRSLSIGAITISPFDNAGAAVKSTPTPTTPEATANLANRLVVYAGHGRFSSAAIGGPRRGLLKSTDGGRNWTALGVKEFSGLDIYRIVPSATDPDTFLVAAGSRRRGAASTRAGVYLATEGGKKFELVRKGEATDIVADPADPDRFYAGIAGGKNVTRGVYRSTDGGAKGSWTLVNGTGANNLNAAINNGIDDDRDGKSANPQNKEGVANAGRIRLALHNSASGNVVYAGFVSDQTNRAMSVYRSTDQAANWSPLPKFSATASLPDINEGGQGQNNFSIVADPDSPSRVYIAGDNDPAGVAGIVWRADLSAGTVWEQVSNTGAMGSGFPTAPHPDTRNMVFDANGGILQVDDGGIYRLAAPALGSGTRTWASKNGNLRLGEFYSVARDSVRNSLFGGLQDIGVVEQPVSGSHLNWTVQPSGDGALAQVSGAFHYTSGNGFNNFERRTWTGTGPGATLSTVKPALRVIGSSDVAANRRTLTGPGTLNNGSGALRFDNTIPFVTEFAVNAITPATQAQNRILIGTRVLYESFDDGATLFPVAGLKPLFGDGADDDNDGNLDTAGAPDKDEVQPYAFSGTITALAYGGRDGATAKPDVAYVASAGRELRVRETVSTDGSGNPSPQYGDFTTRPAYAGAAVKGGEIRDLILDPTDWRKGYVVDEKGAVFSFQNTGSAAGDWKRITGNLGSYTGDVRSVAVVTTDNPAVPGGRIIVVGGLGGVFATLNPGAAKPRWFQVGRGLPRTVVSDVRWDPADDVLYCGTYGRGAWSISNFRQAFLPAAPAAAAAATFGAASITTASVSDDPGVLEITGDDLGASADTIRLVLNAANPDLLDVFLNNATDTPDLSIEASAVRKVSVTGGEGDDTLTIDHANGIVSFEEGIEFDDAGPGNNTRQEVGETPITGGVAARIRDGLEGLADWGQAVSGFAQFAEQIPGLGVSLADTLSVGDGTGPIGGALQRGLVDPVSDFFAGDVTPTVQELVDLVKSLSNPLGNVSFNVDPLSVSGGLFTAEGGQQELRVDLDLKLGGFVGALTLDLDTALESLGASFSAGATVDLHTELNLSFSFGVDLTPGLSDAEAFFISVNELSATARVAAGRVPFSGDPATKTLRQKRRERDVRDVPSGAGLNLALNVGFLDAKVVNGTFELDAAASVAVNNPDDDPAGHITLAELQGTTLDSLLDLEMTGELRANLPMEVSLGGLASARPVINIESLDLFGTAPTVTTEGFDELLNFNNIGPQDVLNLLTQLGKFLGQYSDSSVFQTQIPFTNGTTLGDAIDLGTAFTQKVSDFLKKPDGSPGYAGAAELGLKLAEALGVPVEVIQPGYDVATNVLKYRVEFDRLFTLLDDAPLDVGFDLSPLAGLQTGATFDLSADVHAELTFGIDLSPPGAGVTLPQRFFIEDASASAHLVLAANNVAATANFAFIEVGTTGGSATVDGTVALALKDPDSASTRVTLADLAANVLAHPLDLLVGGAPTITGSAALALNNITVYGIPGVSAAPGARVSVAVPDLKNPAAAVVNVDGLGDLANFDRLSLADIVGALRGAVSFLRDLGDGTAFGSFLSKELPVLNTSVSDLLDYADTFAAKVQAFEDDPAGSLQGIEQAIEDAFGLDPSDFAISINGKNLLFDLHFGFDYGSGPVPFGVDLASLAASLPDGAAKNALLAASSLVQVSGSGTVGIVADADLDLVLGIDFTNKLAPKPFLGDDTSLSLTARAAATGVNFDVNIGPLGAFVRNGSATVDASNVPGNDDPMSFTVDLVGKQYLADLGTLDSSKVAVAFAGAAEINLPLFFPDETTPLGGAAPANALNISIGDLNNPAGTIAASAPDFAAAFGSFDFLNNLGAVVDGIDFLLQKLQQALNSKVLNAKLPLLGDKLKDAGQFIEGFRGTVVSKLQSELAGGGTVAAIQRALFGSIGPGGLNFLTLNPLSHDEGGDGVADTVPNFADVPVAVTGTERVEFDLHLAKALASLSIPIDFDLGIPGLNLAVKPPSAVAVKLGFDFAMGFGISRDEGFYLKTGAPDELDINLDVTLPGFNAGGSLAFLKVGVIDQPADPTHFTASFAVDLDDPIGANDRLTFADLSAANLGDLLTAKFNADVEVNLLIEASFGNAARFPSILSDFVLNWDFVNADTTAGVSFGGVPEIAFNNVRVRLGSFFSQIVSPVLEKIRQITEPMQPVVDILTTRLPVLSDIGAARDALDDNGDGAVTLLELAENPLLATAVPELRFISAVVRIIDLANHIPSGGSIEIGLGSFNLGGTDLRGGGVPDGFNPLDHDVPAPSIPDQLTAIGNQAATSAREFFQGLSEVPSNGSGPGGLYFPIIQNPASAFNLLLGKSADLFIYDMPPLQVGVGMDLFFPLLGPLGVQLSGSLSAKADFAFGFDSSGIQQAFNTGDPLKVFNGFFVSDRINANGTGEDVPEVTLMGRIEAFGAINAVIASAGVGGGLTATIDLNLNDNNDDGKVRVDEIIANLPGCVFDLRGQLKAGISAFVKIGYGWFSVTKRFNIAEVVLLDFSHECDPAPEPVLAEFTSSGVLRLNIGANAAARLHGDTADGDEVFVVNHLGGPAGSEKVSVSAFGFTQEFVGVSTVVADAGEGNDSISFLGVLAASNLQGGNGDDVLSVGDGNALLRGGEGNDQLSSGAGADSLYGDGGDDLLTSGEGADTAEGGAGNDIIDTAGGADTARGGGGDDSIDAGDGNDLLEGGDGNDDLNAGAGADTARGGAGNDTLVGGEESDRLEGDDGEDALVGENGNDTLLGGAGNDRADGADGADTVEGGEGNDTLDGGAANDTLAGGGGNDVARGGDGNDSVSGDGGDDQLYGELGADALSGGDGNDLLEGGADADTLRGGANDDTLRGGDAADSLLGEAGDDRVFGDAGNDTALGGDGNDSVEGGAGDDSLLGGAGDDTVRGQQGADQVVGEAGDDLLFGDAGADNVSGGAGDDEAHGGSENDTVDGDAGDDLLFGDAGDDTVHGNAGADTARGNAGNDSVFGDADADVLSGDAGDDLLEGGGAGDDIHGNDGNDRMIGGSSSPVDLDGGDTMFGDAGDDVMIGDDGIVSATLPPDVTLSGGSGADLMSGGDGADRMYGQGGNDTMAGDAGADVMFGNQADDVMGGGSDDDYMEGNAGADQMAGDDGEDDMIGGSAAPAAPDGGDTMDGGAGADVILGDNGTITRELVAGDVWRRHPAPFADVVRNVSLLDEGDGSFGNDSITGAAGDDILHGQRGDDVMSGGDGDDEMFGELGSDAMLGDAGHDVMLGDAGVVTRLLNGDGSPVLNPNGSWKKTVLLSQPLAGGSDTAGGGTGDDAMFGGADNDTMAGDDGDDSMEGNAGADTIAGGGGEDDMIGGSSDASVPDPASRTDGADALDGGAGHDVMAGDNARIVRRIDPATNAFLRYTPGATPGTGVGAENNAVIRDVYLLELDTVGGADVMSGNAGDDTMFGGLADDRMAGNDGNDDMTGHLGADNMDGGAGSDGIVGDKGSIVTDLLDGSTARLIQTNGKPFMSEWIDVAGTLKRYVLLEDVANGGADTLTGGLGDDFVHGGAQNDLIYGDDPALAGGGKDALFGDLGDDILRGGDAADHLWGGAGNDDLDGQAGGDTAYGGGGDDRLVADLASDRLVDWFGNFNNFIVPFPSYGAQTIIRSPSPAMRQYLLDLAVGDGALDPEGEAAIVTPPSPDNSGPGGRR